jgi:hypothetical protein
MHSGAAGFWKTVRQVARSEMRELRSQPGLYLFVPLILFQTIASSLVSLGAFDTPLLLTPGTLAVTQMEFMTTLLSLLLIFYAVESMERERSTGFSAIANALADPNLRARDRQGDCPLRHRRGHRLWRASSPAGSRCSCRDACRSAHAVRLVWGGLVAPTFLAWAAFVIAAYSVTRNRYTTYGVALAVFGYTVYLALTDKVNWLGNWPMWSVVRWSDMSTLEIDRTALVLSRLFVLGLGGFFLRVAIRQYPRQDRDAIRVMHRTRPVELRRAFVRAAPALLIPVIAGGMLWRQISTGPDGGACGKEGQGLLEEEPRDVDGCPTPRARRGRHGSRARAGRALVDRQGNVRAREQARREAAEDSGDRPHQRGRTSRGR